MREIASNRINTLWQFEPYDWLYSFLISQYIKLQGDTGNVQVVSDYHNDTCLL